MHLPVRIAAVERVDRTRRNIGPAVGAERPDDKELSEIGRVYKARHGDPDIGDAGAMTLDQRDVHRELAVAFDKLFRAVKRINQKVAISPGTGHILQQSVYRGGQYYS